MEELEKEESKQAPSQASASERKSDAHAQEERSDAETATPAGGKHRQKEEQGDDEAQERGERAPQSRAQHTRTA